jgi:hypothetical protein
VRTAWTQQHPSFRQTGWVSALHPLDTSAWLCGCTRVQHDRAQLLPACKHGNFYNAKDANYGISALSRGIIIITIYFKAGSYLPVSHLKHYPPIVFLFVRLPDSPLKFWGHEDSILKMRLSSVLASESSFYSICFYCTVHCLL